jgi:hypothetical protein
VIKEATVHIIDKEGKLLETRYVGSVFFRAKGMNTLASALRRAATLANDIVAREYPNDWNKIEIELTKE